MCSAVDNNAAICICMCKGTCRGCHCLQRRKCITACPAIDSALSPGQVQGVGALCSSTSLHLQPGM